MMFPSGGFMSKSNTRKESKTPKRMNCLAFCPWGSTTVNIDDDILQFNVLKPYDDEEKLILLDTLEKSDLLPSVPHPGVHPALITITLIQLLCKQSGDARCQAICSCFNRRISTAICAWWRQNDFHLATLYPQEHVTAALQQGHLHLGPYFKLAGYLQGQGLYQALGSHLYCLSMAEKCYAIPMFCPPNDRNGILFHRNQNKMGLFQHPFD